MRITESFKGLAKDANENFVYVGDLISDEDIFVDLDHWLTVRGSVITGGSLILKAQLTAEKDIIAVGDIKASEVSARRLIINGGEIKTGWGAKCPLFHCEGSSNRYESECYGLFEKLLEKKGASAYAELAVAVKTSLPICEIKHCEKCFDCPQEYQNVLSCILGFYDYVDGTLEETKEAAHEAKRALSSF